MAKPSNLFRFATNGGVTVAPSSARQDTGWALAERVPARVLNWLHNGQYQWNQYLNNLHGEAEFLNKAYAWTAAHTFSALQKFPGGLVASALKLDGGDLLYTDAAGTATARALVRQVPLNVTPGADANVANWYVAPAGNLVSVGSALGYVYLDLPKGAMIKGLLAVVACPAGINVTIGLQKEAFSWFDGSIAQTAITAGDAIPTGGAGLSYKLLTIGTIAAGEYVDNQVNRYRLKLDCDGAGAHVKGAVIQIDDPGFRGHG
jgi:hypothetical protein